MSVKRSFQLLFHPADTFPILKERNLYFCAIRLQILRWFFTAGTTMVSLYITDSNMLFPTPFGIPEQEYRFYELFGYGPYGVLIMFTLAYLVWVHGREHAPVPMSFRKSFEVVGISFFAPWLPSIPLDNILVLMGWGGPPVMITWHTAIVCIEGWLVYTGVRVVFDMPRPVAIRLGWIAGMGFMILAGVLIR